MKMKLLLFLSCVLCVSAGAQHGDLYINGCSDTDGENMYTVEGEEVWYADFQREQGVDPQPSFVDHMTNPDAYQQAVADQHVCRSNMNLRRVAMKDVPMEQDAPTTLLLYPKEDLDWDPDQENVLICHVSGFYPAPVTVTWTRNGLNVTVGTTINIPFPNKDGTFRQTARLDFTPQRGDIYTCSVEHGALEAPLTRIWDVEGPQPALGPSIFCGLGLVVGLLGVAVGTFFLIKGNECS